MKILITFFLLTSALSIASAQNHISGGWPPKDLTQASPRSSPLDNLFRRTKEVVKAPVPKAAPVRDSVPVDSAPLSVAAAPKPLIDSEPTTESLPNLELPPIPKIDAGVVKEDKVIESVAKGSNVKKVEAEVESVEENRVNQSLLFEGPPPLALPPLPQPVDRITSILPNSSQRVRPPRNRVKSLYTLGPGDTVSFSTFERSDLSRTVRIAPDGSVSYLQAISVNATGLTVDQLRDKMQVELQKYRRDFKLIVTPDQLESKGYAVLGRVREPGTFPIERPVTVLEAIARASGVETGLVRGSTIGLADFDRSFVSRNGRKLKVNMAKLYQGDMKQNVTLQPNDYVYVASALKKEFYILGAVANPGRFKITEPLTVASSIALAGGFNNNAYRMKVLIIRGDLETPDTHVVDMKDILSGKALDQSIKSDDIVFVARRPFDLFERVLDSAITTYVQTLTAEALNQNFTAISL